MDQANTSILFEYKKALILIVWEYRSNIFPKQFHVVIHINKYMAEELILIGSILLGMRNNRKIWSTKQIFERNEIQFEWKGGCRWLTPLLFILVSRLNWKSCRNEPINDGTYMFFHSCYLQVLGFVYLFTN